MLAHLAYVSSRKPDCTDLEIEKILDACRKNNPALNITGVLLYSKSQFIQYVEGEASKLTQLYDKIKTDARHERTVMLSYGPISSKVFPWWHMGSKKTANTGIQFDTSISAEDKRTFDRLLKGEEAEGEKVQKLLKKFFK